MAGETTATKTRTSSPESTTTKRIPQDTIKDPLLSEEVSKAPPKPTYSIEGGGRLMSLFLTDAMKALEGTWYDRSDQANKQRGLESARAESGAFRSEDDEWARRLRENLNAPPPTDVVVRFQETWPNVNVEITINDKKQSLSFTLASFEEMNAANQKIIATIKAGQAAAQK